MMQLVLVPTVGYMAEPWLNNSVTFEFNTHVFMPLNATIFVIQQIAFPPLF